MKRAGRGQRTHPGFGPARAPPAADPGTLRHAVTARATAAWAAGASKLASRAEAPGPPGAGTDPQARPPAGPPRGPVPEPPRPPGQAPPGQPGRAGQLGRAGLGAVRRFLGTAAARRAGAHLLLIAAYILAGVLVTWPVTEELADGQLIKVSDISSYVWALWWMSHQVVHLGDPWFTHAMAAPTGIQLGFDTLMPLPGLIMTPVTLLFSPAASFAVLTVAVPGLLCYVMYRAARLWLGQAGAIAAGAFFGLSTMLVWQNLYHLNISIGTLFLPLTLEAAVRLRRRPGRRSAVILGVILGASVLTNQESAVVAVLLAAAVLVPWLIQQAVRRPRPASLRPLLSALGIGAVVAVAVASPQLFAMARQASDGGTTIAPGDVIQLTQSYRNYGVGLPTLFAPSPRLGAFHLGQLASAYHFAEPTEGIATFGVVLSALAVAGLVATWRRRSSWWLALLWAARAALALGPTLTIGTRTFIPLATTWRGVTVSPLMPYTWLIRIPGLSALREADRLALLGLLGAAVLAGAAVQWVCDHARPVVAGSAVVVIAGAGFLEAGWSAAAAPRMAAALPSVDGPVAADRSGSIVVDVPFGLRGGVGVNGDRLAPEALLLATADGHPRAISYTSWVPRPTKAGIASYPFYRFLYDAQLGAKFPPGGRARAKASRSARHLNIGWIIVWHSANRGARPSIIRYLFATGFSIDYSVKTATGGITVWRRPH